MTVRRGAVILCPLLLLAAGCSTRQPLRGSPEAGTSAGAAGADAGAPGNQGGTPVTLQQQLVERDREIARLRTEVAQLHEREAQMHASLERGANGGGAAAGAATNGVRPAADSGSRPDVVVSSLRAALSQEQERRQMAETQLTRLKEETSASAYAEPHVPQADFLAVKQELVELRQTVADQRANRKSPADTQPPPQNVKPDAAAPAENAGEAAELRARLQTLQQQKDAIVESLNRNLADNQVRIAELEHNLAVVRAAAPTAGAAEGDSTELQAENVSLRTQLDQQRHRTDDLEAKLKVAIRLSDLIFKIQAQQARTRPTTTRRHHRRQAPPPAQQEPPTEPEPPAQFHSRLPPSAQPEPPAPPAQLELPAESEPLAQPEPPAQFHRRHAPLSVESEQPAQPEPPAQSGLPTE